MNNTQLQHVKILEEHVFQIKNSWPQFRLLIDDITTLSEKFGKDNTVVALERTLMYGGFSLFAPIFNDADFISIDCSPASAESRGGYNSHLIDHDLFIRSKYNVRCKNFSKLPLPANSVDLLIIPNLVHHVKDQAFMFQEISRVIKPHGYIYIFEGLVREIHQYPDDFIRYTPEGMKINLENVGFENIFIKTEGGPFQVLAYCWMQALQYLDGNKKIQYEKWFHDTHFQELMNLDSQFKVNLCKPNSSFPAAFSLLSMLKK